MDVWACPRQIFKPKTKGKVRGSFFFLFYLFYIEKAMGKQKYVEEKSRLSPNPAKKTVGKREVRGGGPVNIRGALTLLS